MHTTIVVAPDKEQGAEHSFASPLPQSLAFSRAFLIQGKHPQQNKTTVLPSAPSPLASRHKADDYQLEPALL